MDKESIIKEFKDAEAILNGHFILSSGLHSDTYLQCARVLMDTSRAERLCKALSEKIINELGKNTLDMVVSPAMGGVVVGYEMGRQLNVPTIFCERVDGEFELRRGFNIPKDARILIVEDVVTTGKSSIETMECIKKYGGKVVAEACLIERNSKKTELGIPLIPLISLEIKSYTKDDLPSQLKEIPAIKPGSRWLNNKIS